MKNPEKIQTRIALLLGIFFVCGIIYSLLVNIENLHKGFESISGFVFLIVLPIIILSFGIILLRGVYKSRKLLF